MGWQGCRRFLHGPGVGRHHLETSLCANKISQVSNRALAGGDWMQGAAGSVSCIGGREVHPISCLQELCRLCKAIQKMYSGAQSHIWILSHSRCQELTSVSPRCKENHPERIHLILLTALNLPRSQILEKVGGGGSERQIMFCPKGCP